MEKTIQDKTVTYDFTRLIDDAEEVSCSKFGELLIKNFENSECRKEYTSGSVELEDPILEIEKPARAVVFFNDDYANGVCCLRYSTILWV